MSSLKELHDRYPKNLFPTIWERINLAIAETQLYSHVEVLREIRNTTNPQDKLLKWGNKHRKLFVGIDNCQRNQIHQIRTKYNPSHWQNKMNRPAPWADPYLIAMAVCEQAVIVTQEHKTKNERIPPIANQFGITSLNLLEFFQALKIKL
ncbi:MAG: DUF4411 family protein [Bacteroidetes bacterium]|nr:DUF4411 family protein [Bacteroidota bacterium]